MSIKLYIEIEVEVDYDYSPAEPMVQYPNEDAYPGCAASVDVTEVKLDGKCIEDLLDPGQIDQIENMCWDHIATMNEEGKG
jgi:hypothetical protein